MEFHKPHPLKPKDKIAVVSPSSGMPFLFPWVYEQGLRRLKEVFELEPVEFSTARKSPEFLSQNPKARADDINRAFADPSIKGIIATIGGNDQVKILPFLDKKIIQANPKIFMGYSDNTNLHLVLWNLGIISYYGGAIMTQFAMGKEMHEYTIHSIQKALFHSSIGLVVSSPVYSDADLDWSDKQNLHKNRPMYPSDGWHWHEPQDRIIEGRLWGGCLEVLHFHLGIQRFIPSPQTLNDTILFIETSEEMPSSGFVYRFIASLAEIGLLKQFQAILVGFPKAQFCGHFPPEGRETFIQNQQNAITAALKDYGTSIPVIFNMNFGHTDPQMILPNGGRIRINTKTKTIEFIG